MTGRRDPGGLQGQIEELLSDLWQIPRVTGMRIGFRPPVDCYRTADPPQLVVAAEIAGADPALVNVVVAERTLVVSGERRRPVTATRPTYLHLEIDYGPFQRRIELQEDVDIERAHASYENGLLTIVLPLAVRAPRKGKVSIEVKIER